MKSIIQKVFRFILRIRYKITIQIEDDLKKSILDSKKGKLFICNHMSLLDGPIAANAIYQSLGWDYPLRVIMIDTIHETDEGGFLPHLLDQFDPILIPEFRYHTAFEKRSQVKKAFQSIAEGLKQGQSFLFFPAGKLQYPYRPQMKNERGLHDLIELAPDVELILMRISGMWGSLFSIGYDGTVPPPFDQSFLKGVLIAIKNGIFFTPKRPVSVELEACPKDFPKNGSIEEIAEYLNHWWNLPWGEEGEPRVLVPHYFYGKNREKDFSLDLYRSQVVIGEEDKKLYLDQLLEKLNSLVAEPHPIITASTNLKTDLTIDSVELIELLVALDPENSLGEIDLLKMETAEDLLALFFLRNCQNEILQSTGVKNENSP